MPIRVVENFDKETVPNMVEKELNRLGSFRLLKIRKLAHQDNRHLRYVMAHNEKKEEYVVWLFNMDTGGLYHGDYYSYRFTMTREVAMERSLERFINRK